MERERELRASRGSGRRRSRTPTARAWLALLVTSHSLEEREGREGRSKGGREGGNEVGREGTREENEVNYCCCCK